MTADQGTRKAEIRFPVRNDRLAELVERNREFVLDSWIQSMRIQHIERFASESDEFLRERLDPSIACMIHLLRTGDIAAADDYMQELISKRLREGYLLVEIERSVHALEVVVLRLIESEFPPHLEERIRAFHAISELHDLIAMRVAEVYQCLQQEEQKRFLDAYELGTTLSKSLDLRTVLDTGVRKLAENMGASSAAVVLAGRGERPTTAASMFALTRELADILPSICRALGCGPEHVDVMEARAAACVVPDISKAEPLSQWAEVLSDAGCRSLACVPLITAEQVLGTAVVLMSEQRDLSPSEVDYLLALVGHIATAVQNALLFEEAEGKRDLDLLLAAGKLFASTLDMHQVLREVAKLETESLGADYSYILMPDPAGERLHVAAFSEATGRSREAIRSIMDRVEPEGLEPWRGASGRVFTSGEPLLISDYARFPDQVPQFADVTGSIMLVPMKLHDTVTGVFALVSFSPGAFDESDVSLARAIADQAAIAIENARLYESVRQSASEAQTLYSIATLASSTLNLDEVLEILVREIADIAGVGRTGLYLIDPGTGDFKLRAHIGFDDSESRSIERESVGQEVLTEEGLMTLHCGKPIFVPNPRYHTEKLGHLLRKYGTECSMVLPFVSRGKLIGAALVDDRGKRHEFPPSVIRLLSSVARTAAISIENARLMQHERNIAETLQKSFLPPSLPPIPGYELAAKYRAALEEAEVGGDFYDVFHVNSRQVAFLVADVAGKGIAAAVFTAAGKYMLRAYALDDPSPASVMYRVNDALCKYLPVGMFITMFYGVLDPESHRLVYANAGHDEPMLYCMGDGRLAKLEVTGPATGNVPGGRYEQVELTLETGDTLLLYTDGATDVRRDGRLLSPAGLERIFAAYTKESAEQVVEHVFEGVLEYSGGKLPDDIALMALKRTQ